MRKEKKATGYVITTDQCPEIRYGMCGLYLNVLDRGWLGRRYRTVWTIWDGYTRREVAFV